MTGCNLNCNSAHSTHGRCAPKHRLKSGDLNVLIVDVLIHHVHALTRSTNSVSECSECRAVPPSSWFGPLEVRGWLLWTAQLHSLLFSVQKHLGGKIGCVLVQECATEDTQTDCHCTCSFVPVSRSQTILPKANLIKANIFPLFFQFANNNLFLTFNQKRNIY